MTRRSVFSTTEVANLFGVTRATVSNWIKDGDMGNVEKVGRVYSIPYNAVSKLIDNRIAKLEQKRVDLDELAGSE